MAQKRTAARSGARKKVNRSHATGGGIKRASRPKSLVAPVWGLLPNGGISLTMPIITISEANRSEHWTISAKRHKKQKQTVKLFYKLIKRLITLPCHLTLTRIAPRSLDKADNLPASLKYVLDSICEEMTGNYIPGRADSDERISVAYDQEKSSSYGVKIIFDCNPYHS